MRTWRAIDHRRLFFDDVEPTPGAGSISRLGDRPSLVAEAGPPTAARGRALDSVSRSDPVGFVRWRDGVIRYVIDAPTLLHVVANGVEVSSGHQIVAPNFIRSHALSLLLDAVRRGDLSEAQALAHHERLTELKMRLLGDRVSRRTAWKIARDQSWETTFDAEYVAVTKLQADALVTVNPTLAMKAKDLVRVARVDALTADPG